MTQIRHSIDVNAPLRAAYNQWTQFEDFPRFMEGVREVRQLDDARLHWRADRQGREIEWDSEIVEQVSTIDVLLDQAHSAARHAKLAADRIRDISGELASVVSRFRIEPTGAAPSR